MCFHLPQKCANTSWPIAFTHVDVNGYGKRVTQSYAYFLPALVHSLSDTDNSCTKKNFLSALYTRVPTQLLYYLHKVWLIYQQLARYCQLINFGQKHFSNIK